MSLKSTIRKAFYRSSWVRAGVGLASVLGRRTESMGILHLLSYLDKNALGPLQRDEAIALFGIVRTIRPQTLVEFGFYHGHSAFNFLCAMEPGARLFSYDVNDESKRRAETELDFDPRLKFFHKSQTAFAPEDLGGRPIDFVFFDAAHDLGLNQTTFELILPCLAPEAVLAVHDTGLWDKAHFEASHEAFAGSETGPGRWVTSNLFAHQPEEREFIDWVLEKHPSFTALHLHSTRTLRHGLTLLQRQTRLPN